MVTNGTPRRSCRSTWMPLKPGRWAARPTPSSGFSPPKSAAPSAARFSNSAASGNTLGGKSRGIRGSAWSGAPAPSRLPQARAIRGPCPRGRLQPSLPASPAAVPRFSARPSTRKRPHQAGSRAGDQPGGTRTPRCVWFRVTWAANSFWRRSSTRMIRPSGSASFRPRCCQGRLQGHFHAVAVPRVAKKAGMDKISGCNRDCTRLRLSPSTGFRASRASPAPHPGSRTPPRALDGQHAGHDPGLRRLLHPLPPRSRMTRPSLAQSVEQVLKRFLRPGQIKETDQIVEAHWTDLPISPSTPQRPARRGRSRTSVRRPCGERSLPGRAGLKRLRFADGIAKVPALAGMFFIENLLDVEKKGRGIGEEAPSGEGVLPPPRPDLHLLRLLEAGRCAAAGARLRPDRGGFFTNDGFGTEKGMKVWPR